MARSRLSPTQKITKTLSSRVTLEQPEIKFVLLDTSQQLKYTDHMFSRRIIHIDMDAFFASVEQRDHPEWRDKPLVVGGQSRRGVVAAASYEARRFGVHSAMPGFMAKQKCPHLIFAPHRFGVYKEISNEVRHIFSDYTDLIEPLSIDEAYLDVTKTTVDGRTATSIAEEIRARIFKETLLTCSAGVSYCKFLAKLGSDFNKPNGLTVIRPNQAQAFLDALPIEKFFGVGRVTARKLHLNGFQTGADLRQCSEERLRNLFGRFGGHLYMIARGLDERPVQVSRVRKSVGMERTFFEDLSATNELESKLDELLPKFYERLEKANFKGRTLTLKVKTTAFQIITRSISVKEGFPTHDAIRLAAFELLHKNRGAFVSIRLMGLSMSNELSNKAPKSRPQALSMKESKKQFITHQQLELAFA